MESLSDTPKVLYYTQNHEWIEFQGSIAYVGCCPFLFDHTSAIPKIRFKDNWGGQQQGAVIATIQYENSIIPVHLPVDGEVMSVNDLLLQNGLNLSASWPENNGWLALIVPSEPNERKGLMDHWQYQFFCQQEILKKLNDAHKNNALAIGSMV